MKKIAILLVFLFYILNAQNVTLNSDLNKSLKNIETLDKVPNILDLKREDTFFYFDKKEAFGDIEEFVNDNFNLNKSSPKYKIYIFYRDFLKAHIKDKNKTLLNRINLDRVNFVYRYFIGENRDNYYIESLKSLTQKIPKAYEYLAKIYFKLGRYKEALESTKLAPKNKDIKDIIKNIKSKYLSLTIEKVNLPNENILARVDSKNINRLYIKVIKLDLNSSVEFVKLSQKEKNKYLKFVEPYKKFNIKLPKDSNYKTISTEISLNNYPLGSYGVLISTSSDFKLQNSTSANFKVSNLSLLNRDNELLVLDRKRGTPISNAKIILYEDINRNSKITSIFTDKNGLAKVPRSLKRYFVDIIYKNDKLSVSDLITNQIITKKDLKPKINLYLFKDKSSYMAGDTLNFKGLIVKNSLNKRPKIIPNRKIKLELLSVEKKFDSKIFKSDEFGAFSGSLKIPREINENLVLKSTFNSEKINIVKKIKEKFKIDLKTILEANRVKLLGKAISNSNKPIYIKSVRLYLLKNGELIKVSKRDIKNSPKFEFKFDIVDGNLYKLFVVVTNLKNQKEFTSLTLNLKKRLKVKLQIDKLLNKNSSKNLKIEASDFMGRDVNISGKIIVEKITPIKLVRYRYWQDVDIELFDNIEFGKKFVSYLKKEDREIINEISFDTKKSNIVNLNLPKEGIYKITILTTDRFGKEIKTSKRVIVYDEENPKPPFKTSIWYMLDKKSYSVGSTAILKLKSSNPNAFVIFELEKNGEIIREEFIKLNQKSKISIPILKEYRGGLNYSLTTVVDNRVYTKRGQIDVPWDNRLELDYISFNKILTPKKDESWKFKIKSKDKKAVTSQMLALISDETIEFNIDKIYPKNIQNFANLWRAFEFDTKKLEIKRPKKSLKVRLISPNIIFKLKDKKIQKRVSKTILFKPKLNSNEKGEIELNFKTPEDLGKWKLLALVHSKDLKFSLINNNIEIRKDLIVKSETPSFFRMGDTISIINRVLNRSSKDLNVTLSLQLINLKSNKDILNGKLTKKISIKSQKSKTVEFQIEIPNLNIDKVEFRVIAKSKEFKDELKKIVPLVKSSHLDIKSMLFRLEPKESKNILFTPIKDINISKSPYKRMIIEFTSNLSWEAIMATKSLIEKDANSNIEIFDKYFVSSIVLNLLKAYRGIDRVNIFNGKELAKVKADSLNKLLKNTINSNGGWGWFGNKDSNFFVTLYILDGFRKLKEIGIRPKVSKNTIEKAIRYVDSVVFSQYNDIKNPKADNLSANIIYYLYVRSFYNHSLISKEAYKYYIESIKKYWKNKSLYEQSLTALTLNKKLGKSISLEILENIEKYLIANRNLALYFNLKEVDIVTHTTAMELFSKLEENSKSLELMKIWLIEQKGVSDWGSSILTANSVYAILSHSRWILDSIKPIDISFNSKLDYSSEIKKVNSSLKDGVGYYRLEFNEFDSGFSNMKLKNSNDKLIWGHAYLEYLNSNIEFKNLPIVISKHFNSKLKVGDIVDITLKIKLYRGMSFLVLKDELPLAFELVEDSGCFAIDGLKYYKLVKKGNISLYFPYLSKGEHTFKYKVKVTHKGIFLGGVSTIKSIFSNRVLGYSKIDTIKVVE